MGRSRKGGLSAGPQEQGAHKRRRVGRHRGPVDGQLESLWSRESSKEWRVRPGLRCLARRVRWTFGPFRRLILDP